MVSLSSYRRHHAELLSLQAANQADSVFSSDTLHRRLVRYFDRYAYTPDGLLHPGRTANDRLLAHYLLGRAYADMGDAPMAVEEYLHAINSADTLYDNCDFAVLRGVYGQLAELYHKQDMPESELSALQGYRQCSWIIGDTITAVSALYYMTGAYHTMHDTAHILSITEQAHSEFIKYGYPDQAAGVWPTAIHIMLVQGRFKEAKVRMDEFEQDRHFFDEDGNILPGCEEYYVSKGLYCLGVGDTVAAEKYFRKALKYGHYEEAYSGLLSTYTVLGVSDSITLYASLYAEANDASHLKRNAKDVIKIKELFNYNQHKQHAQDVEHRNRLIIIASVFVLTALGLLSYVYSKRRKRIQQSLHHASESIVLISNNMKNAKSEINVLKGIIEKQEKTHEVQLDIANDRAQELHNKCKNFKHSTSVDNFYTSTIVGQFKTKAKQRNSIPTDEQWKELEIVFQKAFPELYQKINTRLTQLLKRVSLLCIIDLSNKDISFLMEKTPHDITSYRSGINQKMFDIKGATGLRANLHEAMRRKNKI